MLVKESNTLLVHCGRCGKPMLVDLNAVKGKRVIDCEECERKTAKIVALAATSRE